MLDHPKFWCQVVNDESVHALLNSYLRKAPRYKQCDLPANIKRKHDLVHRLVFLVFQRMSTTRESKSEFISKEYFGQLIYDNFLFDIPRLMDISALYGNQHSIKLVRKVVSSVFECQQSYVSDLQQAAKTVVEILTQTENKCLKEGDGANTPASLASGRPTSHLEEMDDADFSDLVLFLSDITHTLQAFLVDVYPKCSIVFFEAGLVNKLDTIFCETLKALKSALHERKSCIPFPTYQELNTHLKLTHKSILKIVHHLINTCLLNPILKATKEDKDAQTAMAERYFENLTLLLSHRPLISELQQNFNLIKDVEAVLQTCHDIEAAQPEFILQTLKDIFTSSSKNQRANAPVQNGPSMKKLVPQKKNPSTKTPHVEENTDEDMKMMMLVSSVQDLFHDLGATFIKACLKRFDMNPEKVIQMILDDNLPPDIQKINRTEEQATSEPPKTEIVDQPSDTEEQPGPSGINDVITERKNIYDNDQFDVMTANAGKSVDKGKIHRGKKDKSDIEHWGAENEFERLRELYSKYDLVKEGDSDEEDFSLPVRESAVYEDEYDDTYDDVKVSANDLDNADDLLARRLKAQQMIRQEESDSDDERPNQVETSRQNFIENPEVVRARKEAARQRRQEDFQRKAARKKGKPGEKNQSQHPPTEGAQKETRKKNEERDRRRKEANKSSRSNHNRKSLATRKAASGM
uniref:Activating signal cointegrator 1 complex subunit 2-like n=1 Tax=Phallusia mammillata TaxID=59560 RepID=A0A6F9D680_9ASCI|nr:activating signal cointegrator 1 complex subunit 2-like [Phallusia mammillata]